MSKGAKGELKVTQFIERKLMREGDRLFNNVTLKVENGTVQIDHVLITWRGIFVIETKNMQGTINGNRDEEKWMQTRTRKNNNSNARSHHGNRVVNGILLFKNPVRQNHNHMKKVQKILNVKYYKIHSFIIFAGRCKLELQGKELNNVMKLKNFEAYMRYFNEDCFTKIEISKYAQKLNEAKMANNPLTTFRHLYEVKKKGFVKFMNARK